MGWEEINEGFFNGFYGLDGLFRDLNDMGLIVCFIIKLFIN